MLARQTPSGTQDKTGGSAGRGRGGRETGGRNREQKGDRQGTWGQGISRVGQGWFTSSADDDELVLAHELVGLFGHCDGEWAGDERLGEERERRGERGRRRREGETIRGWADEG